MPAGSTSSFQVIYSDLVRDTLRGIGERAKQGGVGADFLASLQTIDGRLRADPLAIGERIHFLPNLQLPVQIAGTPFFYLRFAVDEGRCLVYVIDCVKSARLP